MKESSSRFLGVIRAAAVLCFITSMTVSCGKGQQGPQNQNAPADTLTGSWKLSQYTCSGAPSSRLTPLYGTTIVTFSSGTMTSVFTPSTGSCTVSYATPITYQLNNGHITVSSMGTTQCSSSSQCSTYSCSGYPQSKPSPTNSPSNMASWDVSGNRYTITDSDPTVLPVCTAGL